MKKSDWVLTNGEIGQITMIDYINDETGRWHLVEVSSLPFASLRSESGMSRIEKPVSDILTAVKLHESENQNGII